MAVILLYVVAGSGIEPDSSGYAYHYNFRYFRFCEICGLDYALTLPPWVEWGPCRLVSTPFPPFLSGLGSVSPTHSSKASPNLTGFPWLITVPRAQIEPDMLPFHFPAYCDYTITKGNTQPKRGDNCTINISLYTL